MAPFAACGDAHPAEASILIVCWQLSTGFRFNITVSDIADHSTFAYWLRVVAIGRRPKATLVRIRC